MADENIIEDIAEETIVNTGDVEMAEDDENGHQLPFAEGGPDEAPEPRTSFITYLMSPVVTLIVGSAGEESILTAHQALLVQSPYFAATCAEFSDDGSVSQLVRFPPIRCSALEGDAACPSAHASPIQTVR